MKPGESYYYLSILFDYPWDKEAIRTAAAGLSGLLAQQGLQSDISLFEEYVAASSLGALQEEYVRTFDFNPLCAPYLSHHLYGDHSKKSDFMISLKELYRRHDFTPRTCELPDHVSILFDCASQLCAMGNADARRMLVRSFIAEGLDKMNTTAARNGDLPWRHAIAAAAAASAGDCQEVHHA